MSATPPLDCRTRVEHSEHNELNTTILLRSAYWKSGKTLAEENGSCCYDCPCWCLEILLVMWVTDNSEVARVWQPQRARRKIQFPSILLPDLLRGPTPAEESVVSQFGAKLENRMMIVLKCCLLHFWVKYMYNKNFVDEYAEKKLPVLK